MNNIAELARIFHSDLIRLKRTYIVPMHFCVALVGMGLYLAYYRFSNYDSVTKVILYLQLISISFPLLLSVVCSICIEQEYYSGGYKYMLISSNPKYLTLLSKHLMLIGFAFVATLVSVLGFRFGVSAIFNENYFTLNFYVNSILILIGSNILEYILHLFLSLRFGKGLSIAIGVVETLLAGRLLTELGDSIWQYIPCAWGPRFVDVWTSFSRSKEFLSIESIGKIQSIGLICSFVTILAFVILCIWFSKWEGKKSEE